MTISGILDSIGDDCVGDCLFPERVYVLPNRSIPRLQKFKLVMERSDPVCTTLCHEVVHIQQLLLRLAFPNVFANGRIGSTLCE